MTFLRLTRGHAIAFVAALALLLFAGIDWYTTAQGAEARRIERLQATSADVLPPAQSQAVLDAARRSAESHERNAWQAEGVLEWLTLVGLLASAAFAILAGFMRAAGRAGDPLALAGWFSVITLLLIGLGAASASAGAVVELGLPLSVAALVAIAAGALTAGRAPASGP